MLPQTTSSGTSRLDGTVSRRGWAKLVLGALGVSFLAAVAFSLSSRVIVVEHPFHGRLRYHRVFGRIVRVDIDTKRTGRYDRELRWTFRDALQVSGSATALYPDEEVRDVNFDGQWDTWIRRSREGTSAWSIDTNNDGKADVVRLVDDMSLPTFNTEVKAQRGFGLGGASPEMPFAFQ